MMAGARTILVSFVLLNACCVAFTLPMDAPESERSVAADRAKDTSNILAVKPQEEPHRSRRTARACNGTVECKKGEQYCDGVIIGPCVDKRGCHPQRSYVHVRRFFKLENGTKCLKKSPHRLMASITRAVPHGTIETSLTCYYKNEPLKKQPCGKLECRMGRYTKKVESCPTLKENTLLTSNAT
eukprot:scpid85681/ scgid17290/ 